MVWLMKKDDEITVDMPEEWKGIIPSHVFLDEAKRIVEEGKKRGFILRVIGGAAIRLHSLEFKNLAEKLGRLEGEQEFTDLDFMAYRKQQKKMPDFFRDYGNLVYGSPFIKRKTTLSSATTRRHIYFHPKGWYFLDVFFDELKMNHTVKFKNRLEIDPLTISVTDLLLEKLQICEFFGEKDLKDSIILIRAHDVGDKEENMINAEYIAELLAKDWGFYYTFTENLKGIKELLPQFEALSESDITDINLKIDKMFEIIDAKPKGVKWKARAKIGTKKLWYRPVETSETVGSFGIWRMKEIHKDSEK